MKSLGGREEVGCDLAGYMACLHSDAAASIAPAPLKAPGLVISTDTGYFHSMSLPQPAWPCQYTCIRSLLLI